MVKMLVQPLYPGLNLTLPVIALLNLSFPIRKMGMMIIPPASWNCWKIK